MGLFDGQGMGNAPESLGDMYRGVARGIGTGMIDPYMEGKGYTSKENQILNIMKGVDLTSAESVSDTFNRIMQIDPQSAAEFQKQVMPMLESNQAAQSAAATRNDPGTFRKSLNTAALILGCDLDTDSECRTKAYELVKDYKRQDVWEGGSAEALVDDMVLVQEEGAKSLEDGGRFEQLLEILPQIYTGWNADTVLLANKIGATMGIASATENAGQMELFAAGGMEQALKYISQTKGAVSDREFEAFRASAPGLDRTEAGNRLMLQTAQAYATFRQNKAAEQNRWVKEQRAQGKVPLLEEWSAHLLEWANKPENILHLPTDVEIEATLKTLTSDDTQERLQVDVDDLSQLSDEELLNSLNAAQ
jgi:hypothetical protein